MAPYRVLSCECVVVVVGNYKVVTLIYEIGHHLGMLLKLLELRRILIGPTDNHLLKAVIWISEKTEIQKRDSTRVNLGC